MYRRPYMNLYTHTYISLLERKVIVYMNNDNSVNNGVIDNVNDNDNVNVINNGNNDNNNVNVNIKKNNKSINENAYDITSKRILSKKSVLCNIMKECIPEYKNLSKQEILACIDDNYDNEYIETMNTEDIGINDETINFDILFTTRLPNSNERIGMYIDLEPQNNMYPGYELLNRAMYYAARLIDRQKGEAFINSDYNNIRKIYSIWICTNPRPEQKDCINYYTIQEDSIKGNYHTSIDYKKLNIIMLYIGDDYDYNLTGILEMLSLIFKNTKLNTLSASKKLSDSYDILMKEGEVQQMSNLSEGLIQQGEIKGREEGILIGTIKTILNVIKSGISQEEAFRITNADENVQKAVIDLLKEEQNV